MFSFLRRYREVLIVGTLLLWPLISFLSTGHRGRSPNFVDRAVLWLSTPIQSVLTWGLDGVVDLVSGYVALKGAREEANACQVSLSQARAEVNSLEEARAENLRLKALLGYSEATIDHEIIARVIGLNPNPHFQSIHINRGENSGVRVGMPVVTVDGAVGQVVRAVDTSADVMLLTDPSSRVGGLVQRTRVRATVAGTGDGHRLSVDFVRREEDVRQDDVVVSAGTDGIFPPGVVLGVVRRSIRPAVGMFLDAALDPAVEFGRLEEVMVLRVPSVGAPTP